MGKNSGGHKAKGLRSLFRSKAKPKTRSPSPPVISASPPMASTPHLMASPPLPMVSAPQNPPDPLKKTKSGQETEQDKPRDRTLLDKEVKASIDVQENILLAMHKMCLLSYFMSDSSNQLSEAMIEYGKVFEKRADADIDLSTNQVEDYARFRCYSHASKFWSEMSAMQKVVYETLLKDYQHLNRQVASFFELHASRDTDDDKIIGEYNKMLERVGKLANFRRPEDLEHVESEVPEGAHLSPEHREHTRFKPEYASRPRHIYVSSGTCPLSCFTHGQIPHSIETPATYPGPFRPRWGEQDIKASQTMRDTSFNNQWLSELLEVRDNLMISSAEKHNDALRNLETSFLTRVAVRLTNTGFDKLKDAYSKADGWASVGTLQMYAEELSLLEVQAELDESLEPSPHWPAIGSESMGDGRQANDQWEFGFGDSTDVTADSSIGRAFSLGLFPESFIGERADEDNGSDSDGPASDGSPSTKGSEPGPNAPGGNNPRPPDGNSGSNSTGGASAGGRSNNSAREPEGGGNSANSNSYSSYAGSGSSYEGSRRPSECLQASFSKQMTYELSNNESPSRSLDSPSRSNRDSFLSSSRSSLSTAQTSLGSTSDLFKSPKGSSSGRYALTTTQPAPELDIDITSVSSETGTAKAALRNKGEKQKLSSATFGIIDTSLGSKIIEGLGSRAAQAQSPFVNPFKETPIALSTLLESPDEDSVDDYKATRTGRKHRHLRRVPRFIILQGGRLGVFGRHNSYTGTGLKAESPAQGQPLGGYQRLGSSLSPLILSACDAVAKPADPLTDPGSNDSTTYGPSNGLSYKNAGNQAAGTIPNRAQ